MSNNLINLPFKYLFIHDTKLKLGRMISKNNSLLSTVNIIIVYQKNFYTQKKTLKFRCIYKYTGTILKKCQINNYYNLYPNKYLYKNLTKKSQCLHLINY